MTAEELRRLWTKVVRSVVGVPSYYCKGYDDVFERVSRQLDSRSDIDAEKFVRDQIQWVVDNNIGKGIRPSILSGCKALDRHERAPTVQALKQQAVEWLEIEAGSFRNAVRVVGLDKALRNVTYANTPFFLVHMHDLLKRKPPPGMKEEADEQLKRYPYLIDALNSEANNEQ